MNIILGFKGIIQTFLELLRPISAEFHEFIKFYATALDVSLALPTIPVSP